MATPDTSRRSVGRRRTASGAAIGLRYIESSALVAALLERDADALRSLRMRSPRATSGLTLAEAGRSILRLRRDNRLTAAQAGAAARALRRFERRCHIVPVTDDVLARARRPFPVEPVRTLDAVHLATAEMLGDPPELLTVVTRDHRIRANAQALGHRVE